MRRHESLGLRKNKKVVETTYLSREVAGMRSDDTKSKRTRQHARASDRNQKDREDRHEQINL